MSTAARQHRTTPQDVPAPALTVIDGDGVEASAGRTYEEFFHNGDLVKPGAIIAPAQLSLDAVVSPEAIMAELAIAQNFQRQALAETTRGSYGWHALHWIAWCAERGIDALDPNPGWVAVHLGAYAVLRDESGAPVLGEDGEFLCAHRPTTVTQRLAAINKFYVYAGKPAPGTDGTVQNVMRAIRRGFTTRPIHAKAALNLAGLNAVLVAARGDWRGVRDSLILLLRRADLSAGQIARLDWAGVRITDAEVWVEAAPLFRHDTTRLVRLPAHVDPALDPVRLFRRLRNASPLLGAVFTRSPGARNALSRQAITNLVNQRAETVGGYEALPSLPDSDLKGLLPRCEDGTGKALRDAAVLLVGWYNALRRSNLSALNWGDLKREAGAWRILLTRSKTDQEGRGETKYMVEIPAGNALGAPCPVAALDAWHAYITEMLGADPISDSPSMPVFIRFTASGPDLQSGKPARMTGEAINLLVQDLAVRAGLCTEAAGCTRNPYGGHSLRVGFVTEMLTDDKLSIQDVRSVTGHKSLDTLVNYHRQVNAIANSPVGRLLGTANSG